MPLDGVDEVREALPRQGPGGAGDAAQVGRGGELAGVRALCPARGSERETLRDRGDTLAFPPPWEHQLAERNLAAVWAN